MTAELQAGLDAPSLVELAVRRLRAEIVGGAFAPGERLVEEQLTRRFGISRAPLREALEHVAQAEQLVDVARRQCHHPHAAPRQVLDQALLPQEA